MFEVNKIRNFQRGFCERINCNVIDVEIETNGQFGENIAAIARIYPFDKISKNENSLYDSPIKYVKILKVFGCNGEAILDESWVKSVVGRICDNSLSFRWHSNKKQYLSYKTEVEKLVKEVNKLYLVTDYDYFDELRVETIPNGQLFIINKDDFIVCNVTDFGNFLQFRISDALVSRFFQDEIYKEMVAKYLESEKKNSAVSCIYPNCYQLSPLNEVIKPGNNSEIIAVYEYNE